MAGVAPYHLRVRIYLGGGHMASYRIVSRADGLYGVEVTEPGSDPSIVASFATEAEARAYIAEERARPDGARVTQSDTLRWRG